MVRKTPVYRLIVLLAGLMAGTGILSAADDIAALKAQLDVQQKQLDALQAAIANQRRLLDRAIAARAASVLPTPPVAVAPVVTPAQAANPCEENYDGNAVPPYLRLGNVCIQPLGFMDMTAVWRDKAAGSSIGSNFGSFPFNNVPASKLSEIRFSPQNSRIGFRIDGRWKDLHFIGYNEFDFLSAATPSNSGVSNGAVVPRLRLFWVDLRKGKVEFLAGQSWSMMVPNRNGISPLPADLFYSLVVDVNYMAGLPWTRQAGVRVVYHPGSKVTLGVSVENPNQYIGGAAGGSGITLPSAPSLAGTAGTQLDNTSGAFLSTPNLMPDFIGKVAFDPSSKAHVEIAGVVRSFKIWNSATNIHSTVAGGAGAVNANLELFKGLRLISNNFYGSGGGRYLFGQAPDVVVHADGGLRTVTSGGFVEGFEYLRKTWLGYTYFGNIYIDRQALLDSNGKAPIGYGYPGAPSSQNRSIQEFTAGFNYLLWGNPRYGALTFMGQYEYLLRYPWSVTSPAPKSAHGNTVYLNIRYSLPGLMPRF